MYYIWVSYEASVMKDVLMVLEYSACTTVTCLSVGEHS